MTAPSSGSEAINTSEPGTVEVASSTDRYRSRTVEHGACTMLRDATLAFDGLVAVARRHHVLEDREVRRSLGDVVHTITASIDPPTTNARTERPIADVGSVLIERAAARFSTRVLATEIGLRPCPPDVLTAVRAARRAIVAASPALTDRPDDGNDRIPAPTTVVVVYGLLRGRGALEPVLRALAPRPATSIHVVGTPVPVRVDDTRTILDLEYGNGPTGSTDIRLAGAHLAWVVRHLNDAGHRVASTSVATGSLAAHVERLVPTDAGNGSDPHPGADHGALVVAVGRFAAVRTWRLRRQVRRAGASVVVAGRRSTALPDPRPVVGE